ncbi:hypothetical protein, partial [Bacteroides sp. An322]|uniref:hypothetical protein n=1 Tax=Bacteroides sp. An322 TaxID=1965632 RepID=UPI000B3776DA
FASAGTFTSCKDYDDDIDGLRTEITDLKSAVTELQNAVQNGKYVTAVSGNGNVITFTFSDGSTTPITIETESGEPSQTVTIGEDGEVIINGEGTGYYTTKTPSEAEVEAGLVKKGANGTWEVLGENGEYTDTKIPVSGITVSGSEAEGYTFTIVNANGESQVVKLPSVASSITNIDFSTNLVKNPVGAEEVGTGLVLGSNDFAYAIESFMLADGENVTDFKASDWKGNKALPADESAILLSESTIDVRIDPVGADATVLSYTLTNTLNEDAPELTLKAEAEDGEEPIKSNDIAGRASNNLGNGLYTLSMDNKVLSKTEADNFEKAMGNIANDDAYAINAAHAIRSKYALNIVETNAPTLDKLVFEQNDEKVLTTTSLQDYLSTTSDKKVKVGVPVQVLGDREKAVYDIYLEVAPEDAKFNVTFDQDNHTFTIGQNPDWATITDVTLDIIVWTAEIDGTINKTTVTVNLDSEFSTAAEYQPITHNVAVEKDEDNVQYINLQTMKDGFASTDDLNSWIKNVNLDNTDYFIFTDEECTTANQVASISKLSFDITDKEDYNVAAQTGAKGASANYVRMKVDNTLPDNLKLDEQYYLKVTFKDAASNTLNSFVVPITFTAPSVAEQFVVSTNYQNGSDKAIKGYYNNWTATNTRKIDMKHFFKSYDKGAALTLDDEAVVTEYKALGELTSNDLATLSATGVETALISLNTQKSTANDLVLDDDTNREVGYGKVLTINATNNYYADTQWAYTDEADTKTTLTITILSPIYEGVIAATDGSKNLSVVVN